MALAGCCPVSGARDQFCHRPCRAPGTTSVTPVTQHRQRPARRSTPPLIAEIPASAETSGCYGCPFLPR